MPVDGITALAADSDGAVWYLPDFFGPPFAGRLTRYDGVKNTSLRPSQISSGRDGTVWVAWTGAIGRVARDGLATMYSVTPGYISALTFDANDRVWFINRDANLLGFLDETAQRAVEFPLPPWLSSPMLVALAPDGTMWIVSENGTIGAVSASGVVREISLDDLRGRPVTAMVATPSEVWLAIGCRSCNRVSCPFPNDRGLIIAISPSRERRIVVDVGHNNIYALAKGHDGTVYALKAILSIFFGGSLHQGPLLVIRQGGISELEIPVEATIDGARGGMLAVSPDGTVWGAYTAPNLIFRFPAWQVR
jgi:streptogramin lyase